MYDCIVVGAGPGGSTAASKLAKANLKVLVLEKQALPRYKVCGGAVSGRAAEMINADLAKVTEDVINKVDVRWAKSHEPPVRHTSEIPIAYLVMRQKFDNLLAEQALHHGAHIHDGEEVKELNFYDDLVEVKTDFSTYKTKTVIGADGALGITARQSGLYVPRSKGVALEIEAAVDDSVLEQWRKTVLISFGAPEHGYAWVFPKANHLSIGIGRFATQSQNLLDKLKTFTEPLNINWRREQVKAHPIPLGGIKRDFSRPHFVLVGDAANLCDPLSGEGIAYAIESGSLAANSVLNAFSTGDFTMADYQQHIEQKINRHLKIARQLAGMFYTLPSTFFKLFCSNRQLLAWYFDTIKGEKNYGDVWALVKSVIQPHHFASRKKRDKIYR
ncbi:MAG: geranylgeranyl reductase family protein [Firmicutes bacterium]|nr:geranylgeranyl reductase family protein [Bacillota bacterium]